MVFYTQITMEAAEDPEFLAAMRRARIRGALVGVESVTPEGLKAVFKNFNDAGEALVTRLQAFRTHGVHVLGSFIFGLPTDTPDTFAATADLAQRAGVSFAQFVMLTPFPGTIDFAKWEREPPTHPSGRRRAAHALLADPSGEAAQGLLAASDDVGRTKSGRARRRSGTSSIVCPRSGSDRRCVTSLRARLAFVLISKLYRQMYANTGIATDSARVARSARRARGLAKLARRLFMAAPMPNLEEPSGLAPATIQLAVRVVP